MTATAVEAPVGARGTLSGTRGPGRPEIPSAAPVASFPGTACRTTLRRSHVEVLNLASHGLTMAQIARRLDSTPRAVQAQLAYIARQLGVSGRTAAVTEGFRLGLLKPRPLRPGMVVPPLPERLAVALPLIAAGLTDRDTAGRLGVHEKSAYNRARDLRVLLGAADRAHVVRLAVEAGYLDLGGDR